MNLIWRNASVLNNLSGNSTLFVSNPVRKVNLDEILEYKNINEDYFNEKVKNGIINSYYSSFDDSKDYDYLIDENLKTYENDTNKKFFIYDNGDINLLPENIKNGVTIFGVTGTYVG